MTLLQILALIALATLLGLLRRGRALALVGFSALVIYWIQPVGKTFPTLAFWLPTFTIFITVLAWALTAPKESRSLRENWPALAVLVGVIAFAAFASRLPLINFPSSGSLRLVALALAIFVGLSAWFANLKSENRFLLAAFAVGLLAVFVFLKSPFLSGSSLAFLTQLRGRELDPAAPMTISWLGYSYVAFRLLHTIRDRQSGVLPAVTLAEYVDYVIFFPAFTAGPIDRLERFVKELREPLPLKNDDWLFAGQRLAVGLFKKFFVAEILSGIAADDLLVSQTRGAGWLWLVFAAYSFLVYFDFSGYTDIAIGMARLLGFRLPENFNAPFLKPNLSQFWNAWHMTLTQWFRAYFFNPLNRSLRSAKRPLPAWAMILITQVSTMLLIGIWHGVTWNYALWGIFHGLGLFVQNRWTESTRRFLPDLSARPVTRGIFHAVGVALTFGYFTLGMTFFALSTPQLSFQAILKLFGIT